MDVKQLPLSLYVHIPWCVRKCPYCDFNSHTQPTDTLEDAYVQALLRDLAADYPLTCDRTLHSIFIGGGTPSLFSPQAIDKLLTGIDRLFGLDSQLEITLEANPGTVDEARFAGFRHAGITRLSLGIQSFDNASLKAIGRIHDGNSARQAIKTAQTSGFQTINLDLMFGLPGQDLTKALTDLQTALDFAPQHLSWYQLTLEPHTAFYHTPPQNLPNDDALWDIQQAGLEKLAAHAFQPYEISAFARQENYCQHNLNYWLFGDYLGIGAGAHGKLSHRDGHVQRYCKPAHPRDYLARFSQSQNPPSRGRTLQADDLRIEFMLNALRLHAGFEQNLFETRTGQSLDDIHDALNIAIQRNWLIQSAGQIRPTKQGLRFLNEVLALF